MESESPISISSLPIELTRLIATDISLLAMLRFTCWRLYKGLKVDKRVFKFNRWRISQYLEETIRPSFSDELLMIAEGTSCISWEDNSLSALQWLQHIKRIKWDFRHFTSFKFVHRCCWTTCDSRKEILTCKAESPYSFFTFSLICSSCSP